MGRQANPSIEEELTRLKAAFETKGLELKNEKRTAREAREAAATAVREANDAKRQVVDLKTAAAQREAQAGKPNPTEEDQGKRDGSWSTGIKSYCYDRWQEFKNLCQPQTWMYVALGLTTLTILWRYWPKTGSGRPKEPFFVPSDCSDSLPDDECPDYTVKTLSDVGRILNANVSTCHKQKGKTVEVRSSGKDWESIKYGDYGHAYGTNYAGRISETEFAIAVPENDKNTKQYDLKFQSDAMKSCHRVTLHPPSKNTDIKTEMEQIDCDTAPPKLKKEVKPVQHEGNKIAECMKEAGLAVGQRDRNNPPTFNNLNKLSKCYQKHENSTKTFIRPSGGNWKRSALGEDGKFAIDYDAGRTTDMKYDLKVMSLGATRC